MFEKKEKKKFKKYLTSIKVLSILNSFKDVNELKTFLKESIDFVNTLPKNTTLKYISEIKGKKDVNNFSSCDFSILPPRLIIEHIFSFISFKPTSSLDIYGKFKKDKRSKKHVWEVFKTVEINFNSHYQSILSLNWRKITSLTLYSINFTLDFIKIPLTSLKTLKLFYIADMTDKFLNFSKFEKLRFLHIDCCMKIRGDEWDKKNLFNLEKLYIQNCNINDNCFILNDFKKLKNLKVEYNYVITGKGWNKLENLEFFMLKYVENFEDDFFQSQYLKFLKQLKLLNLSVTGENWIFENFSELNLLLIENCENLKEHIIIKSNFKNLNSLSIISPVESWNFQYWEYSNFSKNLTYFKVVSIYSENFTNKLFIENSFSNLKTLDINLNLTEEVKFGTTKWEMKNLRSLKINSNNFDDNFFKETNISNIEELSITSSININGKNWNEQKCNKFFAKLKVLSLENQSFDDTFFQNPQNTFLPNIKYLSIKCCMKLKGINWKELKNLTSLKLKKNLIRDNIFKKSNSFNNLLVLELKSLNELEGKKWGSSFLKLRILRIIKCKNITDQIFQETLFQNLEILKIKTSPKIKGIEWKEFYKLHSLIIENGIFFRNIPFQKEESIFPNLQNLYLKNTSANGRDWKELSKLKLLSIKEQQFSLSFFQKFFFSNLENLSFRRVSILTLDDVNIVRGSKEHKKNLKKLKKIENLLSDQVLFGNMKNFNCDQSDSQFDTYFRKFFFNCNKNK